MSTNIDLLDTQITYIDLPGGYPELNALGGGNYQPAGYTEGNAEIVQYAILLPIDANEAVALPEFIVYDTSLSPNLLCALTIETQSTGTSDLLAMIKFSIANVNNIGEKKMEVYVSDTSSKGGGYTDRHLGKVVMDSNILP